MLGSQTCWKDDIGQVHVHYTGTWCKLSSIKEFSHYKTEVTTNLKLLSIGLTLTELLYLCLKWSCRRHVKSEVPLAGVYPSAPTNDTIKRNRFEEVVYYNRQQGFLNKYDKHLKKRFVPQPPQPYALDHKLLDDEVKVTTVYPTELENEPNILTKK